ncbi:MAG: serpin family protein [Oscillospiraceae bacterium]
MKKSEKMFDAVTDIRDDLVEKAEAHKPRGRKWWPAAVAAVLVVALVGGVVFWPGGAGTPGGTAAEPGVSPAVSTKPGPSVAALAHTIAAAEYPEMAQYPGEDGDYSAWWKGVQAQQRPEGYADGLEGFFTGSIREFLSGAGDENRVYSPVNVYMALAMLAELTDGNSRAQILDLLGSGSIEAVRAQASDVWNANYCDDGLVTSVLASSVWLNENVSYVQETMDTLAEVYYASSYQGEMGSEEFNKALQDWLNQQTGGLLEEQAGQIEMNANTILALATTIYFRAQWADEFSENRTQPDVFHANAGDVTCDFMNRSDYQAYYWGGKFSAVALSLQNAGNMWLILPDEGVGVDALLQDEQAMEFLLSDGEWESNKFMTVNLSVPKFDVTSQLDLIGGLKALGVTDVFDAEVSDFSPMTRDVDGLYVSQAQHDARVTIDEEGCTAAAYTVIAVDAGGFLPPEEEIDFVLDRPFLFAITGADGVPLFVGVVNRP